MEAERRRLLDERQRNEENKRKEERRLLAEKRGEDQTRHYEDQSRRRNEENERRSGSQSEMERFAERQRAEIDLLRSARLPQPTGHKEAEPHSPSSNQKKDDNGQRRTETLSGFDPEVSTNILRLITLFSNVGLKCENCKSFMELFISASFAVFNCSFILY